MPDSVRPCRNYVELHIILLYFPAFCDTILILINFTAENSRWNINIFAKVFPAKSPQIHPTISEFAEWGYSSLQWGEKLTDLERKNFYNQDVCRNKYWDKVWGKGHTPEAQADYVIRCQEIFAQHPNVIGNFFFRWSDAETCWQCGEPDCPAECAWGCVDTHENPKPAYWALKEGNKRYFNKG